MNRADRMLEALADGERHSRHEIFALAGCFFLTNNAAAELRARGLEIEQTRDAEEFYYRLVSLRDATEQDLPGPAGPVASQSEDVGSHDPGSANPLKPSASLVSDDSDEQLRMVIAA